MHSLVSGAITTARVVGLLVAYKANIHNKVKGLSALDAIDYRTKESTQPYVVDHLKVLLNAKADPNNTQPGFGIPKLSDSDASGKELIKDVLINAGWYPTLPKTPHPKQEEVFNDVRKTIQDQLFPLIHSKLPVTPIAGIAFDYYAPTYQDALKKSQEDKS